MADLMKILKDKNNKVLTGRNKGADAGNRNRLIDCLARRSLILLYLINFCFANPLLTGGQNFLKQEQDETVNKDKRNVALGIGLLAAEYTIGPAIAYFSWWKEGFILDNPLKYIDEKEPYLADNAWHIIGCDIITDLHYHILQECFASKNSVLLSTSLALFDFTIVECLDALEKTGRWEFSPGDAAANVIGVGFWTLKHYYPSTPVDIRVGVRKWNEIADLFHQVYVAVVDFERFQSKKKDHYSIFKIEGIYRVHKEIYCGVALSKKDAPSEENLWGVTAGWDIVKGLKGSGTGSRNNLFGHLSEYLSIPISFTFWLD